MSGAIRVPPFELGRARSIRSANGAHISRLRLCVFVGLMVFARAAAFADAPKTAPTNMQAWFEPTEPAHIVGPIYYVGTRGLGVYLITTPSGHVLIDGAMPPSAPLIEASIRKLGFEPKDIKKLLITHAHVDHVGTLAYFKRSTGAPVAAMGADVELLESGGTLDYLYANDPRLHFEPVVADRTLADGDAVEIGGITLVAHATPGHTRGCTTWTTTVGDGGKKYRVEFVGSTSVNPGTRLVADPSYPGIADDYRRSFALLESLHPDIWVAPHAPVFGFDEKRERAAAAGVAAYVDPDGYRRMLAASRQAFDAALAREVQPAAP